MIPNVKLILLLRNPVDRAYSHYHHEVSMGVETLSFEEAIDREDERLKGEWERMLEDEGYYSFNHQHYSYLSRGIYVDQVKVWMELFSRKQILILKSEDFYANPANAFGRTLQFLELPRWEPVEYGRYNSISYPPMDATVRRRLLDYFEAHNQRLYEYLGTNFGWDG